MNPYGWQPDAESRLLVANRVASGSRTDSESEIRSLRGQVDRLTLACQLMWELIRDHGSFTEEDLQTRIAQVDLRDGALDGKLGSTVLKCPSCSRNTNSRRESCVWCGDAVERRHVFEG